MAVTTSFSWSQDGGVHLMNNLFTAGNQFLPEVAANAARTEFFGAWSDGSNGFQAEGRIMASDATPISDELTINDFNNTGLQFDPDVAGLSDGSFVAVYNDLNSDLGGDIRATLFGPLGFEESINLSIDTSTADDTQPRVAALADGGFVVTWTRMLGGGNFDIRASIFEPDRANPDDGPIPTPFLVDGSPGAQTAPDVAGLASGNLVAVWEDDSNHTVYFRRFNSSGTPLDQSRMAIDSIGTVNKDIHVVGLSDGGFAVAYTDNGWGISGTEITFQIFNANGTPRTGFILANDAALGGVVAGDQDRPTITTLGNGLIVVGWQDETAGTTYAQVFDAAGNAIGTNQALNVRAIEADFAGLSGPDMAVVLQSTVEDGAGNGNSIREGVAEFTRTFRGDGANDTIVGLNDGLREIFDGQGGDDTFIAGNGPSLFLGSEDHTDTDVDTVSYANSTAGVTANLADPTQNKGPAAHDIYSLVENLTGTNFNDTLVGDNGANTLRGGAGNDTLTGAGGKDIIDGGPGTDTAVFAGTLASHAINWSGANITLNSAADALDTTHGIERFQFSDGTVAQDDGNALVDDLFYDSRNPDVWNAHVDADAHYAAFGWHEGRNPNPFFSTNGYLSANPDVKAANVNPLDQYHTSGWLQGHDPSASFDTELYLLRNPDVAAAHIDPLEHFLAFGREEGRQASPAVGRNLSGDFDSEFYLLSNPDVGFAGVDPLAHYNTSGWHEGRNPDAFFDTAGYLAAYPDVAAAGVNPLEHYHLFGWKEGRDPSGAFDTNAYLAANPDVAAAHIDPLQHFLQFGIYEGRSPHGDGLFN